MLSTILNKRKRGTKMGLKTFKGGVHPYEGKELAKDQPIKEVLPKGDLVYPVSQHIGAPANPIVAKGDTVLRGQKIAEAGGFVSSPIYASVSGTVKAIEPRRVAVGDMVNSIVIENDGEYKEVEFTPCEDVTALSKEEIINKVKESAPGTGFNAATEEYVDMVENGILDPVKVTRSALQNATSVASTLLTTESVVANIKEDAPAMPAGNPGMGMM